jgi:hypothetical protein
MRAPTKVITKQNTRDNGSSMKEIPALKFPELSHVKKFAVYDPPVGGEDRKIIPERIVRMADRVTDPTASIPTAFLGSCRPNREMIRKLSRGSAGISPIIAVIS